MNCFTRKFLCLALILSALTVVHGDSSNLKILHDLSWPKIESPEVLLGFAQRHMDALVGQMYPETNLYAEDMIEISSLNPFGAWVTKDFFLLVLDTHPFTGQAFLILRDPAIMGEWHAKKWPIMEPTDTPRIIRVLEKLHPNYTGGALDGMETVSIRWRNIVNLDREQSSDPKPLSMGFPAYPMSLYRAGINGMSEIKATISEQGRASITHLKVSHTEFEPVIREIVQSWRFEPGVSVKTRKPTAVQISLKIEFTCFEEE